MTPFDFLRERLSETVPFARHAGVTVLEVGSGVATARIDDHPQTRNHIGSQHAGALFTVAETASGAAMAGAFLPVLLEVRPVAAQSTVRFTKVANGAITAQAKVVEDAASLLEKLKADGKVQFPVEVVLSDQDGETVGEMTVDWHVSKAR